jgi:hypothetical protein
MQQAGITEISLVFILTILRVLVGLHSKAQVAAERDSVYENKG